MKFSTYTLLISATQAIRMEADPQPTDPQPTDNEEPQALKCQAIEQPPLEGDGDQPKFFTCNRLEDPEQPEPLAEGEEDMCLKLITKEDCERGRVLTAEEIEKEGGDA